MSRNENEKICQSDHASERDPLSAEVTDNVEDGEHRHSFVRPAQKHWWAADYRRPVPQDAVDFSRLSPDSTISFPDNRFKTTMWPCKRCRTVDEVMKFLSSVPLIGREIECINTYGPCTEVNERAVLAATGDDTDYEEEEDLRKAYLGIPDEAQIEQHVVTHFAVKLKFTRGGSFELDGDREPCDWYLAMNQIDWNVRPEVQCNMNLETFFENVQKKVIARIEVVSSIYTSNPLTLIDYEKPQELVDWIVFWLDGDIGLRFTPDANGVSVEVVDASGQVKTLPWREAHASFYTLSDICYDPVTNCVSEDHDLMFGEKGCQTAEWDCVQIWFVKDGSGDRFHPDVVTRGFICREHAAILSLAAFKSNSESLETTHNLLKMTRGEWKQFLDRATKICDSYLMSPTTPIGGFVDRKRSVALLHDLVKWSSAVPESATAVWVGNIWGFRYN